MKKSITIVTMGHRRAALIIFLVLSSLSAWGQMDPAMQEAREETLVVNDLGRFFGYLNTMEDEQPNQRLTESQRVEIRRIMEKILNMSRIEPDWADETLDYLELELLTPAQLLAVDKIALARQPENSASGTGTGGGKGNSGSSTTGAEMSPLQSYINGGPYNPIVDSSKSLGQGFMAYYERIK